MTILNFFAAILTVATFIISFLFSKYVEKRKRQAARHSDGAEGMVVLLQRFKNYGIAHGLYGHVEAGEQAGDADCRYVAFCNEQAQYQRAGGNAQKAYQSVSALHTVAAGAPQRLGYHRNDGDAGHDGADLG